MIVRLGQVIVGCGEFAVFEPLLEEGIDLVIEKRLHQSLEQGCDNQLPLPHFRPRARLHEGVWRIQAIPRTVAVGEKLRQIVAVDQQVLEPAHALEGFQLEEHRVPVDQRELMALEQLCLFCRCFRNIRFADRKGLDTRIPVELDLARDDLGG